MPYKEVTGILTDIGTEELAHMEMICAIVYQLTKDLSPEEIKASGFDKYYVDHTLALWPRQPVEHRGQQLIFSPRVTQLQIYMKIWPQQKARTTYDNILRLVKDPEVCDPIRF